MLEKTWRWTAAWAIGAVLAGVPTVSLSAQDQALTRASTHPAGNLVPRPLFRDPVFDAPTDPVLCYNAEQGMWFMYYTQRRATTENAPGVSWVHGTKIGIATSSDGGATWTYQGTANIDYGEDEHPGQTTYWAPEVIWHDGLYHMFLSYVPGIFDNWNHPRQIVHLTSTDGISWTTVGPIDLGSDRVIDASVIQLPDGTWRMWYKDERQSSALCSADSPDLYHWTTRGRAVRNQQGEGPKVIHWQGRYWLIADTWRTGMKVWSSDDAAHWVPQAATLVGSHGDAVVSGGRAWWFYFGGPRIPDTPGYRRGAGESGSGGAPRTRVPGRSTQIDVVELHVVDGTLIADDPNQPTYIDLRAERESER